MDFDLSWHQDSQELTFVRGAATTGYFAPEQVDPGKKVATRSALVDSYGLGMTMFFIFGGRDPAPSEAEHANWSATLEQMGRNLSNGTWKSVGTRMRLLCDMLPSLVSEHRTCHIPGLSSPREVDFNRTGGAEFSAFVRTIPARAGSRRAIALTHVDHRPLDDWHEFRRR